MAASISRVVPHNDCDGDGDKGVSLATDGSPADPEEEESESFTCVSHSGLIAFLRISLFVVVGVPGAVLFIAAFFGGVLAAAEGWSFYDGFLYVTGNLVGLATPLCNLSPDGVFGQMLDAYIAALSVAMAGVAIGFIGSFSFVGSATEFLEGKTYTDNTDILLEIEMVKATVLKMEKRLDSMHDQFHTMATMQEQLAEIRALVAHR